MDIIYLIVGLGMILGGANLLTDGASALAKRWGVSDLVIGLTVVAFGTSAPELVISLVSAFNGSAELAIGNVVGSNIFNILAIIGVTALIRPMKIERSIMTSEIPFVIVSSVAVFALGAGGWFSGGGERVVTRADGIILLLFFAIFMRHTFGAAKTGESNTSEDQPSTKTMPLWKGLLWVALGLGGLILGGNWFVDGASGIASSLVVSDAVIGLTIVAAGTSLPELATSAMAAVKGKTGIALGNVIGSNIFNVFLVLGASSLVKPLAFGSIGLTDLLVLLVASVLFWVFGWLFKVRTITRGEGAVLVACYIGYIVWLVANS